MPGYTQACMQVPIYVWEEEGIQQQQLEGAKRNKQVYEKLARELQKTGRD